MSLMLVFLSVIMAKSNEMRNLLVLYGISEGCQNKMCEAK